MKLSVIIPAYNAEKLVSYSLKSLVNQRVNGRYEILVINDGSLDGTLAVLNLWKEKYPELIRVINKNNGGVSSARNAGIEEAKGEWIMFCDADDYIAEWSLGNLMEYAFSIDPEVDLINFAMKAVDSRNVAVPLTYGIKRNCDSRTFFRSDLYWCSVQFLFKRELIMKNKIRFQNVPASEDTLFNIDYLLSLSKDSTVLKLDTVVYYYFNNPTSVTRDFDSEKSILFIKKFFPIFGLYRNIINKYELKEKDYERMKWVMAKCVPNFFARLLHSSLSISDVKLIRNRMKDLGVIPFNEVRTSPLSKSDKVKEFLLMHPLCFVVFRFIYMRFKGYKY